MITYECKKGCLIVKRKFKDWAEGVVRESIRDDVIAFFRVVSISVAAQCFA